MMLVRRMLLITLLVFLCGVRTSVTENNTAQQGPPPLLLVSFDGFRADYLQRFPMPNLKFLYSQGVLVEQLNNVFITKTFPNHYSLVTGLYAESHGMLASYMYDPVSHKHFNASNGTDPLWWSEAQPLWLTALDSGYKTAAMMWPGSDVTIGNRTATHFHRYDASVTFQQRLGNVTKWILGDGKEPGVKFAALYWEEPDRSGHIFGPENTTAMSKVLKEVDDNIGLLISELNRTGLWGHINIMVTSDHGMAQCSADRLIRLDHCLHPDNYTVVDLSPVAAIFPRNDVEAVYALLNKCHPNMTAYLKKAIPDRLHYKNNERIQQIILIADEGWTIIKQGDKLPRLGDHGYDNSLPSMHPFLAATGPSFRRDYRMSSLQTVDIYPLMCHLLSVPPKPNNGTLAQAQCMLVAKTCWNVALMIGLVVGVLLILSIITVLFSLLKYRNPLRPPRPFRRLQVDYDDDDDPLLQ
ncbi:bis(5'-adenosyl)-triphosphatase enpp4 isoform X1 [Larimichthys crocea]|uniref:bis(5'-adenosyl)-triphosphatase enpp4 isoform X1 n=2 Tax=Larimichthys crocea TaxID=215358 RepID=UPI000F5DEF3F|nr:bis(5'-adenosyl)-triphosphatase ENPP4 isoform X1 [Larimichthys crocea]XP_027147425.1 bis(5'-adenosyl)-triphosphatase ENPP4 isoform X1 [Larimichthys crocea]